MTPEIPKELKADLPQTTWGKVLSATPIVMAVVATLLAGLSSSEMTKAQYDRSLAAQQQSKIADQWSFFQAKRLRGSMQRSTLDVLQSTLQVKPLAATNIGNTAPEVQQALLNGVVPELPTAIAHDENLKDALDALEAGKTDAEIAVSLAKVKDAVLKDALIAARDRTTALDDLLKPLNQAIDQLEKSNAGGELTRSLTSARLRFTANRYDAEARLNQVIANIYELQVRKSNTSAERHHKRSGIFFYGMLAAQLAVIIATFSIAARKRNWLWSAAAAAGAVAVSFAVYVYVFM